MAVPTFATYAANTPLVTVDVDACECCTPSLCSLDPCVLICNFVNLLPSGPIWDRPKMEVMKRFEDPTPICVDGVYQLNCLWEEDRCTSIVRHSVYTALRLYDALMNALWPAIRESDPTTAYDTMDDWLDKLGWVNCFETACRDSDLGELTPYELESPCGRTFCFPDTPDCLDITTKHGILMALHRMQLGGIRNLEYINFVIRPLNACFRAVIPPPVEEGDINEICPVEFDLCPIADEIPTWERDNCLPPGTLCQAFVEPNACYQTGLPQKIYPGLLAAECIIRSMLPRCGTMKINRFCDVCDPICVQPVVSNQNCGSGRFRRVA